MYKYLQGEAQDRLRLQWLWEIPAWETRWLAGFPSWWWVWHQPPLLPSSCTCALFPWYLQPHHQLQHYCWVQWNWWGGRLEFPLEIWVKWGKPCSCSMFYVTWLLNDILAGPRGQSIAQRLSCDWRRQTAKRCVQVEGCTVFWTPVSGGVRIFPGLHVLDSKSGDQQLAATVFQATRLMEGGGFTLAALGPTLSLTCWTETVERRICISWRLWKIWRHGLKQGKRRFMVCRWGLCRTSSQMLVNYWMVCVRKYFSLIPRPTFVFW